MQRHGDNSDRALTVVEVVDEGVRLAVVLLVGTEEGGGG